MRERREWYSRRGKGIMQTQAKDKEQKKGKKEKGRKEKYKEKKRERSKKNRKANPFYVGLFFFVFCALDSQEKEKTRVYGSRGYQRAAAYIQYSTSITKSPFGTYNRTRAITGVTNQAADKQPTQRSSCHHRVPLIFLTTNLPLLYPLSIQFIRRRKKIQEKKS